TANFNGSNNTAIGISAGSTNTSGTTNTFAGANTSGGGAGTSTNGTFVGNGANSSINGADNQSAFGNGATSHVANGMVLGNAPALVGIGTSDPEQKLDVIGNTNINNGDATIGHITPAFTINLNTGTSTGATNINTSAGA